MRTKQKTLLVTLALTVPILAACSGGQNMRTTELEQQKAVLDSRQKELDGLQSTLSQREQQLARQEASLKQQAQPMQASADPGALLLPPGAKSGECYARVWVPAAYRTVSEEKMVKEASERIEVIPARYEMVEETVLVKEASTRKEVVPAVYGTETETIKVKDEALVWKTALGGKASPASQELLAAARKHGIDLDAASAGMCYHEHYRPAQYATEEQSVLVGEASTNIEVSAPQYRWVEKTVLVKEASSRLVDVPAVYEWVEETVLDKPAHTIWKKGTGPIQKIDEATGEIMCLVEVPATYKTIKKRVLKTPASTRTVEIPAEYQTVKVRELVEGPREVKNEVPARYQTVSLTKKISDPEFVWHPVHDSSEPTQTRTGAQICLTKEPAQYKTVTRQVVKQPATVRTVEIPAEYKTVKVRKQVAGPSERRTEVPAEYRTVTSEVLDKEGYMEWRSILCETNMTGTRISQIQSALKQRGFDPGPIDGVIGAQTMTAVNAFQRDQGLPVDKYLNLDTLAKLGVSPR